MNASSEHFSEELKHMRPLDQTSLEKALVVMAVSISGRSMLKNVRVVVLRKDCYLVLDIFKIGSFACKTFNSLVFKEIRPPRTTR